MKQALTLFAAILLLAVGATAQKLSYQAVVRNDANELVAGATVQVTVSVLNATGDVQYAENHANVQTNLNGLLSLMIGDGTPTGTATMADVVWTGASVKTIITLPGGVSVTSVTPVNAVPYALYADNVDPSVVEDAVTDYIAAHGTGGAANVQADWNVTDPTSDAYIQNKPTNVSSFDNDANYITAADIPAIPTVPADVSAFNNDANYITNTGSCANSVNLCDLLEKLELLENQIQPIMILTGGVTEVSTNSFTVNGKVLTNGSTTITQRGFVYATSHNPTLDNNSVNNGSGTGEYTSTITELTTGTTYFVRAFATNVNGTYYGNEVAVTTTATTPSVLPSVTTIAVTNITISEATVKGAVTSDGGENVMQRGFVYGTQPNPTTMDASVVYNGTGVGQFSNLIASLVSGGTYYIRTFATNSVGTAYGNEISFTTSLPSPVDGDAIPCPGAPTVTDHEGNVYNTVKIGTQCWTKENMRAVTSPSTGTYLIPPAGTTFTYTGKQARWYANDSATYATRNYGLLYNWNAAVDTFNTEYGELSVNPTLSSAAVDAVFTGYRRGICPEGWHVPNKVEWTILTDYLDSHEEYRSGGFSLYLAKAMASTNDWTAYSDISYSPANNPSVNNASGFSALPAGEINSSNMFGGYPYRTSFWYDTQRENLHSQAYRIRIGDNSNMAPLADRESESKFYGYSVRCLKDENSGGDTPGGNTSDNTPIIDEKSCTLTPTVTDVDGNTYSTVQIGDQCWMRENLRTTHYSNGDTILFENARKYPNNDQSNVAEYGYLYQWYATMHLDNSYQGQNLDILGICPTGWHVPSYAEWGVLADYAGQNYYGLIASTGFSTQLAGRYWDGYHNFGERNYFWTRDYVVNQSVAYRFMDNAMNLSSNAETENAYAFFSVRCLRDENSGGDTPGGNTPSIPVGDAQPCPGTPTVTDHEGNVYNTVQIGDQCWTKENMRCTTSPKGYLNLGGTASTSATSPYVVSTDTAYYYNWDNLDIPLVDRGMYYNWAGAMDTTAETHITASFTGRRGICPEGWHVPSYEEWNTLTSYVGNQSAYQCNTSNAYVAKALASTNYWNTSSNPCAVGNESVTNNTTGLSIVPAGYFYFESFFNQHAHANMWSSTSYSGEEAAYHTLTDGAADVNQNGNYKSNGRSVRCLRD